MKTTLFAFAFVVALSLSAAAANTKKPAPAIHRAGDASVDILQHKDSLTPAPPALCSPCLFYGGDINVASINAAGMSDENTLLIVGGSSTYGAANIPTGTTATVTAILFNVQADAAFDPLTATYDVRSGVSEGDGGTSLGSGSGPAVVQATGRNFLGLSEYTVEVALSEPLTLTSGQYWFNVTPQCLNTLDGSCSVFRQFVSNTALANNVHGSWQPLNDMFLNAGYFGFTWANWCDSSLGFNTHQCGAMSFGLVGTE